MADQNRYWIVCRRPSKLPERSDFEFNTAVVPTIRAGQALVRVCWLSCDPTQRDWLNEAPGRSSRVRIGDPMPSWGVGYVVQSEGGRLKRGDHVSGLFAWADYVVVDSDGPLVPEQIPEGIPATWYLGLLGVTGLTAYMGIRSVGCVSRDEVVLVSGAAGAVGSVAAQIARIHGARVIGIAGGHSKCAELIDNLRLDGAIDYKSEDVGVRLTALAPDGVDLFFDNVGGDLLQLVMDHLAMHARIVVCGYIATGYEPGTFPRIENYEQLVYRAASIRGFLVSQFTAGYAEARQDLIGWARAGQLRVVEDVSVGLESAPDCLRGLFTGSNLGKRLISVASLPPR